jgi:ABC-type dipeptide/oligopeptide/nickel transport system permease component
MQRIAPGSRSATMTLRSSFAAFVLAMILAFLLGCASAPQQRSAGEYLADCMTTARVKSSILLKV